MGAADDYAMLSVRARLAAGLLTVEEWLGQHRIQDEAITSVLDHMWQFLAVTPGTFEEWHDFQPALQMASESEEPVPPAVAASCRSRGASADELATMLGHVVNIVSESLFGALDLTLSLARLRNLAAVASRSGIALPDASRFSHLPATQMHGWGLPVSPAQLAELRSPAPLS